MNLIEDKKMIKALIFTKQFKSYECIKEINQIIQTARTYGLVPQVDELSGSNVKFRVWVKIYKVYDINEEQRNARADGTVNIELEKMFFDDLPSHIKSRTCTDTYKGYGG